MTKHLALAFLSFGVTFLSRGDGLARPAHSADTATLTQSTPCSDLAHGPARVSYTAPEASQCCGDAPSCARLLATTVVRTHKADLRT